MKTLQNYYNDKWPQKYLPFTNRTKIARAILM